MPALIRVITTLVWTGSLFAIFKQVVGEPGVALAKVADGTANGVQNTISAATGGLVPPAIGKPTPSSAAALPTQSNGLGVVVEKFTNPWLYVALAGLFLFATTLTKQTRGLARDVGGGVSTARDAVKDDFTDLQSDPGNGEFKGRKA